MRCDARPEHPSQPLLGSLEPGQASEVGTKTRVGTVQEREHCRNHAANERFHRTHRALVETVEAVGRLDGDDLDVRVASVQGRAGA